MIFLDDQIELRKWHQEWIAGMLQGKPSSSILQGFPVKLIHKKTGARMQMISSVAFVRVNKASAEFNAEATSKAKNEAKNEASAEATSKAKKITATSEAKEATAEATSEAKEATVEATFEEIRNSSFCFIVTSTPVTFDALINHQLCHAPI